MITNKELPALIKRAHDSATAHGFQDKPKSAAHWLMLIITEINDRYSRCKPINKIYMCDVRGPEIFINGPRNYTCTISFNNVTGDLIL